MASTPCLTDLRNQPQIPITTENQDQRREAGQTWRPRSFHLSSRGFCLGGIILGLAGCILGACMPYRNPVAVTISVLWWGNYLGWFGASIGALWGVWKDRDSDFPSTGSDGRTAAAPSARTGRSSPSWSRRTVAISTAWAWWTGKPKYVTALGESNEMAGWRPNKARGGVLTDVDSGEILCRGLSMPNSPTLFFEKKPNSIGESGLVSRTA
jgi:hypothetical protein